MHSFQNQNGWRHMSHSCSSWRDSALGSASDVVWLGVSDAVTWWWFDTLKSTARCGKLPQRTFPGVFRSFGVSECFESWFFKILRAGLLVVIPACRRCSWCSWNSWNVLVVSWNCCLTLETLETALETLETLETPISNITKIKFKMIHSLCQQD